MSLRSALAPRLFAVALACLPACKGREASTVPGAPLTAIAGADATAFKGERVRLDGSASVGPEGGTMEYAWAQTAGTPVALKGAATATPEFQAPQAAGTLRFALVVSDGPSRSAPDEIAVTVQDRPPTADAGLDRRVPPGYVVQLDARASADPDGDALTYTWFQSGGPAVGLVDAGNGTARFTAPESPATVSFTVLVSDGESTRDDEVVVVVLPPGVNAPPTVSAGPDVTVGRRTTVYLSAAASDPDWDLLSFSWSQLSGPAVTLTTATWQWTSFIAPDLESDLEFAVSVDDGAETATDTVVVHVRDLSPIVSRVAISPASPGTADDLVASADAYDPDGDPVMLSYVWWRNGVALPGQTGSTLRACDTTRGDVLRVVVTASDGTRIGTGEASVTIQDTPPVLVASAPVAVAHGAELAFDVTASDPDGDAAPSGGYVLAYGPAGMAVSDSGQVRWKATLPMFDTALEVRWAVALRDTPSARVSGTIRVEDAARPYPLRRSGIEIPVAHGLAVADLDGDGTSEAVIVGRTGPYELAWTGAGYAQRWMYPFSLGDTGSTSAVAAGDVDGDGRPEIFYASGGLLVELDGQSRREVARLDAAGAFVCRQLELADLTGDGAPELVCLGGSATGYYGDPSKIVVLDAATLRTLWSTPGLSLGSSLAVGNVDADAALEIVASGGYVFDGSTGANEWAYGPGFGTDVDVGDVDGDGVAEIVAAASSAARGFSAVSHAKLWELPSSSGFANVVATDVDGDGRVELVLSGGSWGDVSTYRYDGSNAFSRISQIAAQDYGVSAIAVGDLDGDGAREIVWGTGSGSSGKDLVVVAGGTPLAVEWKNVDPSQLDGPFVGAHLARIAPETTALLFQVASTDSGYAGPRLVALDPATGGVRSGPATGTIGDSTRVIDVFDYDADGVDEAFVPLPGYSSGMLYARDFATGAAEVTFSTGPGGAQAIAHGDLNGDGDDDVAAITSDGYVYALDAQHQLLVWKSPAVGSGYASGVGIAVADLDRDGAPEIVALSSSRVVVYGNEGGAAAWTERASSSVTDASDLVVADCDGDGAPEVYVLTGTYSYTSKVLRFDGALASLGSFDVGAPARSLHVEDLGTARKNLVIAVGDLYASSSSPRPHLRAVNAATGDEVWRSPFLWGPVQRGSLHYVDTDADGEREIAFGTSLGMYLTR